MPQRNFPKVRAQSFGTFGTWLLAPLLPSFDSKSVLDVPFLKKIAPLFHIPIEWWEGERKDEGDLAQD